MRFAATTMGLAVLAMGMLITSAVARTPKVDHASHHGAFVSASGGNLVMTGRNGKAHTHPLAKDVKVTIDGKPGALTALSKGMALTVTTDKTGHATMISTTTATPAATSKSTATATAAKPTAAPTAKSSAK